MLNKKCYHISILAICDPSVHTVKELGAVSWLEINNQTIGIGSTS